MESRLCTGGLCRQDCLSGLATAAFLPWDVGFPRGMGRLSYRGGRHAAGFFLARFFVERGTRSTGSFRPGRLYEYRLLTG